MRRIAIWILWVLGALAVCYVALTLYARFTAPRLTPGDPIEIYRDPDAPNYSMSETNAPT